MSFYAWLAIFFLILLGISILIYVLVIKAFYWGDKKAAPKRKGQTDKTDPDHL
jgi:nitrogen fixation-related uncharacterized protein